MKSIIEILLTVLIFMTTNIFAEFYPYLQTPTPTSIYVCWIDTSDVSSVEYGLTSALGSQVSPEAISISGGSTVIKWFAAKLENLEPSTTYYYKIKNNSEESGIYKFRTQPVDNDSTQHIRFVICGDNRTDYVKFKELTDSIKSMAVSLYGENIEENINLVFNVGDIVTAGWKVNQYLEEYFKPSNAVSAYIPHMVSIGNHERESLQYYKFMKYEDFGGTEGEKYYSFRIGRVLFIAINGNVKLRNDVQIEWLNQVLNAAQNDNTIEWIFAFNHFPGRSEMWPDGNTDYIQNKIIPTLAKYSKVDMLTYGHAHDYERGTALNSGFRLMLNGGGGSVLEQWGGYDNQQNYPEIQKSYNHYSYSIVDIDIANKFCDIKTYSIGNSAKPLGNKIIDHFIRDKKNETPPITPSVTLPSESTVELPFNIGASNYSGNYDIMSSQFQITTTQGNYDSLLLDIKQDFEDIYGAPQAPDYIPIDLNAGIDLTKYTVADTSMTGNVWLRVRYRDKNLQWSDWSQEKSFFVTNPTSIEKDKSVIVNEYQLYSNYPNPFNPTTTIKFDIQETSNVTLSVYNNLGELVEELENGRMSAGRYTRTFNASNLSSGIYFYKLKANNFIKIKKMTLLK